MDKRTNIIGAIKEGNIAECTTLSENFHHKYLVALLDNHMADNSSISNVACFKDYFPQHFDKTSLQIVLAVGSNR